MYTSRLGSRTDAFASTRLSYVTRCSALVCGCLFFIRACVAALCSSWGLDGMARRVCARCYFSRAPLACAVSFLRSLCFIVFIRDYKNERFYRYCSLGSRLRFLELIPLLYNCIIRCFIEHSFCLVSSIQVFIRIVVNVNVNCCLWAITRRGMTRSIGHQFRARADNERLDSVLLK